MSEYPESDFPWQLYFQGITMPKWSNCWLPVDDSRVDEYVDRVHGRIDHVGVVESEEADVFLIAAQQMLLQAIDRKQEFMEDPRCSRDEMETVYNGLISGLQEMIAICENEKIVFWISGYESDREKILDALKRFRLGNQHPEYFEPPHIKRQHQDHQFEINCQRKVLRQRLATIGSNKSLKRFIHALKDKG